MVIAVLSTIIIVLQGAGIFALSRVLAKEDAISHEVGNEEARLARLEEWRTTVDRRLGNKDTVDEQILSKLEEHMLNDTRRFKAIEKER